MEKRKWQDFALLLIDLQADFWSKELQRAHPNFMENVMQLLAFCRKEGLEVIHLREVFAPDGSDWLPRYQLRQRSPCVRGTGGEAVLGFAQEKPGERVFEKQAMDGFQNPKLLEYLHSRRKKVLLTAGLATSVCVLFTSASASQHGFLTIVLEDCCADYPDAHAMVLRRYDGFLLEFIRWRQLSEGYSKWIDQIQQLGTHP